MKIAIVGSGISGLTAAYLLYKDFDIHVFEANDYSGGHTHTIPVAKEHGKYMVDTGFIVFNETTYPNFCKILHTLKVPSQPTEMTFSVRCRKSGIEYNTHSLNTFFSQRKNLFSPSHYRMIFDIFRFRNQFAELLQYDDNAVPLVPFLEEHGYSAQFINLFILPVTAALWSASPDKSRNFPLATFVRFFKNHGFLNIKNPIEWRVIQGGSQTYVQKMSAFFKDQIRLSCPVRRIQRSSDHVSIVHQEGSEDFDQVILAVHSDQALALLADPSEKEKEILAAINYQQNEVVLHSDTTMLPQKRSIWASWNYYISAQQQKAATLSYDMNILQGISAPEEFLVSLNQLEGINPDKIIGRYEYQHPVFTPDVPAAQKRHAEISAVNRTHYCGAYWGYGFHEDGVNSGLAVAAYFGKHLP
ncbi:MAG: FAD-dependent oxidoreductase [Proteobacteria bacterium]|nr:FAD-dependent oxidoreductase [Pseudomonadota bacterium]MBU1057821.1 FAD-dependent oxidoreductase [Pseudomonadota bacterium]